MQNEYNDYTVIQLLEAYGYDYCCSGIYAKIRELGRYGDIQGVPYDGSQQGCGGGSASFGSILRIRFSETFDGTSGVLVIGSLVPCVPFALLLDGLPAGGGYFTSIRGLKDATDDIMVQPSGATNSDEVKRLPFASMLKDQLREGYNEFPTHRMRRIRDDQNEQLQLTYEGVTDTQQITGVLYCLVV